MTLSAKMVYSNYVKQRILFIVGLERVNNELDGAWQKKGTRPPRFELASSSNNIK